MEREKEEKKEMEKKHNTSTGVNGETELKTYFVGDLKHNAVNYDFFKLSFY
jgi:hypothetical protein